ncbi:hypothetical protein [Spongiimicrobium salis]|uniref:hypothetical protein n=1 Tax=Spongiimicrobium salis TaxID=1667022 RepID=UPI00374DAC07
MNVIVRHMIIVFLLLLAALPLRAQTKDTLQMKEIYLENDLVYRQSNDERFSGVVQHKRKNGHLVYEEVYEDGIIREAYEYYNGKGKFLYRKTLYQSYKLWVLEKEFIYGKSKKDWSQINSYNEKGQKILEEGFENEKLVYRCEYLGKKKHGQEFCYTDEGDVLIQEYIHGKKVRKKK